MPWNFTLCTKHPITIRTLWIPNSFCSIVDQKCRAVWKWTIEFIWNIEQSLTQRLTPPFKNLGRKNRTTKIHLQGTLASWKRTLNVDYVFFKHRTDVLRHAIRAIHVRATADVERILHCFSVNTDFTNERGVIWVWRLSFFSVVSFTFCGGDSFGNETDDLNVSVLFIGKDEMGRLPE